MRKTVKHTQEVTGRIRQLNTAAKRAKKPGDKTLMHHYGQLIKQCQDIDNVWDQLSPKARKFLADKRKRPVERPTKTAA